jgi:hypothetical protein
MPVIAMTVLRLLGSTLSHLAMSLMTEKFMRWLIIWILELVVKKTSSNLDNELLEQLKQTWSTNNGNK